MNRKIIIILLTFIALVTFVCMSGCSIVDVIDESYRTKDFSNMIPDIDIDENELESIKDTYDGLVKKYDTSDEKKVTFNSGLKNPFEPYNIEDEEEIEDKNIINLEKIYSKDGITYIELRLNDYLYRLKEDDTFAEIYQLKVINATSAVLLRGDEYITVFTNETYYD